MKINRIYLLILFIMAFMIVNSCKSRFNPKFYYNKTLADTGDIGDSSNPGDFDPGDFDMGEVEEIPIWDGYSDIPIWGDTVIDTNGNSSTTVYLDPFVNGEWNDPNYRFNMNFDDYVIKASFSSDNRPTYRLVKGSWQSSNPTKNEYSYNGENTTGAGQSIQSVKYYLYKSKNPLFTATSKYNTTNRIKRFYFYRFTGKALGMVDTDNYLVAIDTYSKLVFAFAVPVQWKLYMAGTPKAPVKWGSVELGWETDYDSENQASFKVNGASYFYEYDPIGIVKENGEIEIYQWCLDSIGNKKRYGPRIDGGNYYDTSRPIATYGKPGRSPYIPVKTNIAGGNAPGGIIGGEENTTTTKEEIKVTAKYIKNTSSRSGEGWGYIGSIKTMWPPYTYSRKDWGFFTYGIGATVYDAEIPTELVNLENLYENGVGIKILGMIGGDRLKLKVGETKQFSGENSYKLEVENIKDKEIYIELASSLRQYNLLLDYIDENNLGSHGSGVKATKENHIVKLKYDSSKDAFVVYSKGGNIFCQMALVPSNGFTLKRGETKDFGIKYTWLGNWGEYETVDIFYTLEFKEVK